jgi:hypothetical protein
MCHTSRVAAYCSSKTHFRTLPGPVAVTALLQACVDPFQKKTFDAINQMVDAQDSCGAWELPRSPTRPSIWALWPFVSAISLARERILPTSASKAQLLFSGCCIVHTENSAQNLTRRILVQNSIFDWARTRIVAITAVRGRRNYNDCSRCSATA